MKKPSELSRLKRKIEDLQTKNRELLETMHAIQSGEVDALVIASSKGEQVFTLKGAEQPYRELVEAMNEGAATVTTKGLILYCNVKFSQMLEIASEKLVGVHINNCFDFKDRSILKKLLERGRRKPISGELFMRVSNGILLPVQLSVSQVQIAEEKGFCIVATDLTEQKSAEAKLTLLNEGLEEKIKERNAQLQASLNARDEFLSVASHELKTPLTALKLQLQLSRRKLRPQNRQTMDTAELEKLCDNALRQVNSLTRLVDDLLDVSRIRTGHFDLSIDEVDFSELITEITNRFSSQIQAAGCELELDLQKDIKGYWDRPRMEQVIVNLISNAVKYAPQRKIRISAKSGPSTARFIVEDNGPGIPKEEQAKIFERFERVGIQRNVAGLGLGLFIVKKIVDAHQGSIHVQSEVGKGAKFIVDLPLKQNLRMNSDNREYRIHH